MKTNPQQNQISCTLFDLKQQQIAKIIETNLDNKYQKRATELGLKIGATVCKQATSFKSKTIVCFANNTLVCLSHTLAKQIFVTTQNNTEAQ